MGKKRPTLTARQLTILTLIADGKTRQEIAIQLDLSTTTVRDHVRRVLAILGAVNRANAVALAFRMKVLR